MMRNKEIVIACEEFGFKQFALCYLGFLTSVISHPYASQLGACCAADAQRICADVDSSIHMTLSWHSFPFPVCFSALQQMEQKRYIKSSPVACDYLE